MCLLEVMNIVYDLVGRTFSFVHAPAWLTAWLPASLCVCCCVYFVVRFLILGTAGQYPEPRPDPMCVTGAKGDVAYLPQVALQYLRSPREDR